MKTLKQLSIVLCMALAIVSCNKDDDDNSMAAAGGGGDELFTAKVDGADWSSDSDLASLIGGSLTTNNGMTVLQAQGSTNDGSFITLTILGYNGVGTYAIADDDLQNASGAIYGASPSANDIFTANSIVALGGNISEGEIRVTAQDDDGAEGTFRFEAANGSRVVTVTDGNFKVVFDN